MRPICRMRLIRRIRLIRPMRLIRRMRLIRPMRLIYMPREGTQRSQLTLLLLGAWLRRLRRDLLRRETFFQRQRSLVQSVRMAFQASQRDMQAQLSVGSYSQSRNTPLS